jgi:hypothetical protein
MIPNIAKLPRFGTYLYIMCFEGRPHEPLGPVKVGITSNVQSRLASVQTGCHRRLAVLAALPIPDRENARRVEAEIHKLGIHWRLEGEWFDLDPIIVLEVACGVYRLFLNEMDSMFPDDSDSPYSQMGHIGLLHFESQVKDLGVWRDHYSQNSNVTAMSKTA